MKTCGKRFTLIELLVVISIMGILASLLFPALMKAKAAGARTTCAGNMSQVGKMILMYSDDSGGYLIPDNSCRCSVSLNYWFWKLSEDYMGAQRPTRPGTVFDCPSNPTPYSAYHMKMGLNADIEYGSAGTSVIKKYGQIPQRTVILGDSYGRYLRPASFGVYWTDYFNPGALSGPNGMCPAFVHSNGLNLMYADSHVEWKKRANLLKSEFTFAND